MAKNNSTVKPRFTEAETEQLFSKLAQICASIEAIWSELSVCNDPKQRGRLIDTIQTLAQTAGFIADHAGDEYSYYGDAFTWLEIPEGGKS